MKVTALVENKKIDERFDAQHGLSLYIETNTHKILFDTGQDDAFIKNADILGIDLSLVDIAVISHGHYDHGGGLKDFLKINQRAIVYLSKHAFDRHLKLQNDHEIFIGITPLKDMSRIKLIDQDMKIDESLFLVHDIDYHPSVIRDQYLFYLEEGKLKQEIFNHELYLVIHENQHDVLITGCSHKGIEHIIEKIEQKINSSLYTVIGGFHFSHYNKSSKKETAYLRSLGEQFKIAETRKYYACHCTGDDAVDVLGNVMGQKLGSIQTGQQIIIK